MGRKPKGERAQTMAERQATFRRARDEELQRLRAFVQWVAENARTPARVREEAIAHGAKLEEQSML